MKVDIDRAVKAWDAVGVKKNAEKLKEEIDQFGDHPTPRVDAILAECERGRARGLVWDGRAHEWRKPEWTERRFAGKPNEPFMPVDLVKEIFPGARVVGPEPTAEQWAGIEAESKHWTRDTDGIYRRANNDTRERCRRCNGPLIEAKWPDGRVIVQCHHCGKKKKKINTVSTSRQIRKMEKETALHESANI